MHIAIALGITLLLSQIIKFFVYGFKNKFNFLILFMDGGFPSAHSSLVSSLATAVHFEQGPSTLFFAVLVFAIIVMNDSFRVRRETGLGAKVLNVIIEKQKLEFQKLTEREGHTFKQVIAGAIFGIIVTYIVYIL